MSERRDQRAIRNTSLKLTLLALGMFGFCFWVLPPLYTLFCEVTGLNGKTSNEAYAPVSIEVDESRDVVVKFIATKNVNMPWEFAPIDFSKSVNPGSAETTHFFVHNPTNRYMVAKAIPSMAPKNATDYFHKTECFCFEQQLLAPGESADLGLRFIVDQSLPKSVKSITLSYTLYDVSETFKDTIEARKLEDSAVKKSELALAIRE